MSAERKSHEIEAICEEVARLYRANFSLLPLGGGEEGKSPSIGNWGKVPDIPLRRIIGILRSKASLAYAVRLRGLVVFDIDERSEALIRDIERRFGTSGIHVQSPRGYHLYYAQSGPAPNLRSEGLPIDVKTGINAYVAGPHSVRPDGGLYLPKKGRLGETPLTPMCMPPSAPSGHILPAINSVEIPKGERHNFLVSKAVGLAKNSNSKHDLTASLFQIGENTLVGFSDMKETEIQNIAEWAWGKRLSNSLYSATNSYFQVCRSNLAAIKSSDALSLYVRLVSSHGHIQGKQFSLVHKSMKDAGITDLSRERFSKATKDLLHLGLLKIVQNHSAGRSYRKYQLCSLNHGGERGEGLTYIC